MTETQSLEMFGVKLDKKRIPVECKESYGGFEVCHPDHVAYNDIKTAKLVRMGEEIVKKYPSYDEAKKDFEKQIKECYQAEVVWIKTRFSDGEGFFYLNGIKVNWKLRTGYIGDYHLEFNSDKKPTLISETGYKSDFFSVPEDFNGSWDEFLKLEIDCIINCDETGKKRKTPIRYNLNFEEEKPKEDLRKDLTGQKAVIEIERRSNGEHLVHCPVLGFGGECSKDIEGKEKDEIKGFRNALIVRGVKEEDISIHEHTYTYEDDKPEFVEKKIKEHSEGLKKYLKKKYGYPVIIRVLKDEHT